MGKNIKNMGESDLISGNNTTEWMDILQRCGSHDIYHLPQYHILAEKMGEGSPFLFFFEHKGFCAALPFLLRQVSEIEGLEDAHVYDATSVYGYPGIVTNIKKNDERAKEVQRNFQKQLLDVFHDKNIIAFFTRQNPLIPTSWLLSGMAQILSLSDTVTIDLTKQSHEQDKSMTKGHRYDIRKAKKTDVIAYEDEKFENLNEFISIYNETMKRNSAIDYYFFSADYYNMLKKILGDHLKLFIAEKDGVIISAALFFVTDKIIQYHLSGSKKQFMKFSGAKVILDEVRKWGSNRGYEWLHLGGGLGSTQDSLFRFKAGFSKNRFSFEIIKFIIEPERYNKLVARKNHWIESNGFKKESDSFFPDYRAPLKKISG